MTPRLHLVCVAGGAHADPQLLDHFIHHYREQVGVTDFHVFLHRGDPFRERLKSCGIQAEDLAEFSETLKQQAFNLTIDSLGPEWCLTCDLDEFHDYGGRFFDFLPAAPVDHVFGVLVDRFALDGFPPLTRAPLDEQFPVRTAFTRLALQGQDAKILAVKGVHVWPGHHRCQGTRGAGPVPVDHYKWDASVLPRLAGPRGNAWSDREAARFRTLLAGGRLPEAIRGCLLPSSVAERRIQPPVDPRWVTGPEETPGRAGTGLRAICAPRSGP